MADDLEFEISAKDTSDSAIKNVADNLASLQDTVQDLAAELVSVDKGLENAQKSLSGVAAESREAAEAVKEANAAAANDDVWNGLNKELEEAQKNYRELAREAIAAGGQAKDALAAFSSSEKNDLLNIAGGVNPNIIADIKAEQRANETARKQAIKLREQEAATTAKNAKQELALDQQIRNQQLSTIKSVMQARAAAEDRAAAAAKQRAQAEVSASQTARAGQLAAFRNELIAGSAEGTRFVGVTGQINQSLKDAAKSSAGFDSSLANTRYAMHDLSMTAGMLGAALTAGLAVGVKTVTDYETAIANIRRTGEMSADAAAKLRDEFVQMASEIPVAFSELGRIGELAGQLNVPSDRIAAFTENVAMFGATTDVTVDAAATAFGRLDALLPDVQGQYDRLGSSILKVGINSVATESEIISTTSQIAAAGSAAGMTADQVIGLSASFASLGVAPEAARGTVIRVLGLMNAAISEGGENLQAFASAANMSAQEFAASWGTSAFTDSFIGFLEGIDSEGSRAQLALKNLGIWAARDQNNLLKLSQNTQTVTEIMGDAATGFDNAGILGEQFGIKADTLASKLQLLVNNMSNLVAQAGEVSGGAFGMLLDGINGILKSATELVDNPMVQWMTAAAAATMALSAGVALAGSGVGRLLASSLALIPVKQQARAMTDQLTASYYGNLRAIIANEAGLTRMQTRMRAASATAAGLATALKGIGFGVAGIAAVGIAGTAITAVMESLKSNADKAREAFGSFDNLLSASAADAEAAAEKYGSVEEALRTAGSGYVEVTRSVDGSSRAFRDAKNAADTSAVAQDALTAAQERLNGSATTVNDTFREQNIILGQNTAEALRNALLAVDGMADALVRMQASGGFDLEDFFASIAAGDIEGATKKLDAFEQSTNRTVQAGRAGTRTYNAFATQISTARNAVDLAEGALDNAAVTMAWNAATASAAGDANENAASQFDFAAEAAAELEDQLDALSESFSTLKSSAQLGESMASLIEAMGNGAIAAEFMGGAVLNNVDTIQKAVEQSIKVGASFGYSAVESIAALFHQLQQEGINTAALMESLRGMGVSNLGGVSFGAIQTQMNNLASGTSDLSNYFGQLAEASRKADDSTSGAGKSMDKAAKAAEKAAKEVRTLVDYANDLAAVWSRAFDIRFGAESAQDAINQTFNSIRERIQSAKDKVKEFNQTIRELRAEGKSLQSERAVTAYFLSIAKAYGDTLRAGELTAKLGEIDAKIAKNKQDVTKAQKEQKKAQEEASTSLKGNTKQSIENRDTVRGLVEEYQKKIEKLAAAGLSEDQLKKESEKLRGEFVKQLEQLGFNREEIDKYAKGFDDVRVAISKVPKNVTVKANINPALQAFQEFTAKAKKQMDKVVSDVGKAGTSAKNAFNNNIKGLGTGIPKKLPTPQIDMSKGFPFPYASWTAFMKAMRSAGWPYSKDIPMNWQKLAQLGSSMGYAKGGFTGRGGKYEEAGIVHKGEYVIPQEGVNQSTGQPDPAWLARNLVNSDPGARSGDRIKSMRTASTLGTQKVIVVNPVDLGIQSLHAIMNAGGTDVVIGDDAIGRAVNNSNVKSNQIGAA